jgi:hypothetical protein
VQPFQNSSAIEKVQNNNSTDDDDAESDTIKDHLPAERCIFDNWRATALADLVIRPKQLPTFFAPPVDACLIAKNGIRRNHFCDL